MVVPKVDNYRGPALCSATVESRILTMLGKVRLVTWHRGKPERQTARQGKNQGFNLPFQR